MSWFVEHFLVAAGLTYVVVGSEPLAAVRLFMRALYPVGSRKLGTMFASLINCAACTGFWMGLVVGAWRFYFDRCDLWQTATGALACTGLLWFISALTGVGTKVAEAIENLAPLKQVPEQAPILPRRPYVAPAIVATEQLTPEQVAEFGPVDDGDDGQPEVST